MKHLLALTLVLVSAPAASASVQTASGDWSQLPLLEHRGYDHLHSNVMQRLYEISSEGKCRLPGRSTRQLNLQLSFAAQFQPDGTLERIVLPNLRCPEAEGVIGGALLAMIAAGDYRPTGKNADGWYRGNFGFGFAA